MANDQPKKQGFFDSLLASVGLKRAEPEPPSPPLRAPSGQLPRKGTGESFQRSRTAPGTGPTQAPEPERKAATAPLTPEEKAKQSEERRYLIAAFEATPTLIPEFQNPQYMYKLISNERDYTQEMLNTLLEERRSLLIQHGPELTEELDLQLGELDSRAQDLRNDLTRMFLLIKKVAGIQKSGTGGTDFLDPLKQ